MIKVLSHYTTNWKELADINVPIMQEYCDRHGYELCIKEVEPYKRYDGLVKLQSVQEHLKEGDLGLVMDMDAIITNLSVKVDSFIDKDKSLFICEGWNMGVFIIRRNIITEMFLSSMIEDIENGRKNCEQDAIQSLHPNSSSLKVCKHPAFNSYLSELYPEIPQPVTAEQGQWVKGSFICHLPALSMETRIAKMKELKNQIIR